MRQRGKSLSLVATSFFADNQTWLFVDRWLQKMPNQIMPMSESILVTYSNLHTVPGSGLLAVSRIVKESVGDTQTGFSELLNILV